jgi:ABC-2 type transport system ATP-binding protein
MPAAPQVEAIVRVENVVHSYGDRKALAGVSFDVAPAQIFGLLGPNGSGKTTLFRILSTLMLPSGGRALLAGFDCATQPNDVRRHIGVVFQAQSVDVKLSARENLWHQGHLYGLSGAALAKRIDEMLAHVGLADRANDRVETFSGGMLRRVELAKGLLHRPQVLLLDEPTTGLDPGARRDVWLYLNHVRESEGVTVVVTTHLMEEAERCDRLAILNEGKLVALGTPAELKSKSTLGGDVVVLEAREPELLAARIAQRFGTSPTVMENRIRLKRAEGHRFVAEVSEAFPGEIESISVAKPTLEDVFIDLTGHRFWTDQQPDPAAAAVEVSGKKH